MATLLPFRFAHISGVVSLSINSEERLIISGGEDGQIRTWKNFEEAETKTYDITECITAVACLGNRAFVATETNTVNEYNLLNGEFVCTVTRCSLPITRIVVSPKGTHILVSSCDFTVKYVNVEDKSFNSLEGHSAPVLSVAVDSSETYAATSSCDSCVKIWRLSDSQCVKSLPILKPSSEFSLTDPMLKIDWSPNSSELLAIPSENVIKLYTRESWNLKSELQCENETSPCSICVFDPSGKMLAAAYMDGSLRVYDVIMSTCLFKKKTSKTIADMIWNMYEQDSLLLADIEGCVGTWKNLNSTAAASEEEEDTETALSVGRKIAIIDDEDSKDFDIGAIKSQFMTQLSEDDSTPVGAKAVFSEEEMQLIFKKWAKSTELKPFASASTPLNHQKRYMKWNAFGVVKQISGELEGIDVEFHDPSVHHSLHFDNAVTEFFAGDVSDEAIAFASAKTATNNSQIFVAHFASWDTSKEWSADLPESESVECLCIGKGWVAFVSSKLLLRVYTLSGFPLWTSCLNGSVVTMTARDERLAVVYKEGTCQQASLRCSVYALNWSAESVGDKIQLLGTYAVALSVGATLTWLCVTEKGNCCTADSKGTVRILSGGIWLLACDLTKAAYHVYDHLWPVDVLESSCEVLCVPCNKSLYPAFAPKPVMVQVKWNVDLCDCNLGRTEIEQPIMISSIQSRLLADSEVELEYADRKELLKTFAIACKTERYARAYDIASLASCKSLKTFIKYANENRCKLLAEKLARLFEQRQELLERRNSKKQEQEQKMIMTTENANQQQPKTSTQRSIVIRTAEKEHQQISAEFTSTLYTTLSSPFFMQDVSMTNTSAATDLSDMTSPLLVQNFKTPTSRNPFKRTTSQSNNTFTDDGESIFDKSTPKKRLLTKYDQKTTTAEKSQSSSKQTSLISTWSSLPTESENQFSQDLFAPTENKTPSFEQFRYSKKQQANVETLEPFPIWMENNKIMLMETFQGDSTDNMSFTQFALKQYRRYKDTLSSQNKDMIVSKVSPPEDPIVYTFTWQFWVLLLLFIIVSNIILTFLYRSVCKLMKLTRLKIVNSYFKCTND
ncbi:WD repeat and HMG-box DNA-binding protein 1 [Trichinella zimbabwensis]|uniref:WD repeat and HMG-box DNA-binding protein 1 n=1 Tax=Trichinella zimbabwensis TaxID=268475 RepID=A0A0V1I1M3_9BILA|nr:WD repeat and HMG-box DNA-binding protein 1 [Trichinella zimbabwensis]